MTVEGLECLNCAEIYPPAVCRWRCPACGFKDLEAMPGKDPKVSGRKFKEPLLRNINEFLE